MTDHATTARTMTAWRQHRYGGPETVTAETVPVPEPAPRRGARAPRGLLDQLGRHPPDARRAAHGAPLLRPATTAGGRSRHGSRRHGRRRRAGCRGLRDRRPGGRCAREHARRVRRGAREAAVAHPCRGDVDGCRCPADRGEHGDHDPRPLPGRRGIPRARDRGRRRSRHADRAARGRSRRRGVGHVRSAGGADPAAARRDAHVRLPHDRSRQRCRPVTSTPSSTSRGSRRCRCCGACCAPADRSRSSAARAGGCSGRCRASCARCSPRAGAAASGRSRP